MASLAEAPPAVSANRRIIARFIDTWILGSIGSFILVGVLTLLGAPLSEELIENRAFGSWLAMLCMALLDIPCTKLWGRSPGKLLLGLRVVSDEPTGLSWAQAAQRSLLVWFKGLAFGIPLVWIVTSAIAMRRVGKTGIASWDEGSRTRVVRASAV
jgi:uncharacterized RDD family membrane protein YckC